MTSPRDTECEKSEEKLWQDMVAPYPVPLLCQSDWLSRLVVFGVVVLPPAIVYGLFRLGWSFWPGRCRVSEKTDGPAIPGKKSQPASRNETPRLSCFCFFGVAGLRPQGRCACLVPVIRAWVTQLTSLAAQILCFRKPLNQKERFWIIGESGLQAHPPLMFFVFMTFSLAGLVLQATV